MSPRHGARHVKASIALFALGLGACTSSCGRAQPDTNTTRSVAASAKPPLSAAGTTQPPLSVAASDEPAPAHGPAPSARTRVSLRAAGLREALAALAELDARPVFVAAHTLGAAACGTLDVEGEGVRGDGARLFAPALAKLGLALEPSGAAWTLLASAASAPAAPPRAAADCEIVPYVIAGAPPTPSELEAVLGDFAREVGAPTRSETSAGEDAHSVETRVLRPRGQALLAAHAALVLRTARILVDATDGAAGALQPDSTGRAPDAATSGAPPHAEPAGSSGTDADSAVPRALRVFFPEAFADRGPLFALGLRSGDRVLAFAPGRDLSIASAVAALGALATGTRAALLVERRGARLELVIEVRASAASR